VYVQDASNRDENVYIARAGNDLIFRDSSNPTPKTLTDLLAGGGGGVFGSSYSFGSSEPSSSTSSNTYQQKLKLTAATAAGTYVVFWQALMTTSSANKNFQARIQVDDSTTLMEVQSRVAVAGQDFVFSGVSQVTLTAANHDFDIDYSSTVASSTSMEKARIVIWRIS
jgi:hypothetical protein